MASRYSRSLSVRRARTSSSSTRAAVRALGLGVALALASAASQPARAADAVSAASGKPYAIPAGPLGDTLARGAAASGSV